MTESKPRPIELADWADWFCRNVKDPQDFRWQAMADMATELRLLHGQKQELLDALKQLSFAAMCRDNTMGDPCRLITVKAELASANKYACEVIAKITKETK